MLLEKLVIYQLANESPLVRVFLKAFSQDIFHVFGYLSVFRDFDFFFDYLDELLFLRDFEWILSNDHLVHHNA
jgi:hypothetical protein